LKPVELHETFGIFATTKSSTELGSATANHQLAKRQPSRDVKKVLSGSSALARSLAPCLCSCLAVVGFAIHVFRHVLHGLIQQPMAEVGECADDAVIAQSEFPRAMRTTKASTSDETGGRTGYCRCLEPPNFWATSFQYQARIVSGLATQGISQRRLKM